MALSVKRDASAPTAEMKDDPKVVEKVETVQTAAEPEAAEKATNEAPVAEEEVVEEVAETEAAAEAESAEASNAAAEEAQAEDPAEPAAREAETAQAAEAEQPAEVVEAEVVEPEVEQPKAQAESPAAPESTAVAVKAEGGAVALLGASAAGNHFAKMIAELAGEGQEGLEFGFGVFPLLSLDKGEFKVGDEDIGKGSFKIVPLLSKPKFAYRTTGVSEKDSEVVFADTDQEHTKPNSAVSAKILEWKDKLGAGWEVKQYQDVFAYIVKYEDKPELEGQLCQLSVAPTSVKLYTRACLTVKQKGYQAHECVFEVGVGEKIRGEFDYYPWSFKALGSCRKLGVEVAIGGKVDENF